MKKSLLALAVLGAFAGAASAQSSVTVYGIVDAGFNSTDTGAEDGRTTGITSGNQSASRIGFKGTEDLGNGLKANFVLESGFDADDGNKTGGFQFGDRISTVGLSGGFGAVNLGKQTSAIKDAYDQIDPFGDGGTIAPIGAVFFNGDRLGGGRITNSVKYTSNSYSGFKFGAAYGFGETAGSTSTNSNFGVNVGYANGPLNVQFGYHNQDRLDAGIPRDGKDKSTFLGATYNFGVAKLHGAFGQHKVSDIDPAAEGKARSYMVGASAKVGAAGNILASYTMNEVRSVDDTDTKVAAIMYTHDLSKRTNLYAGYSHISNDANAVLRNVVADESGSVMAVGIRHKF